jgi:hypothetical protein
LHEPLYDASKFNYQTLRVSDVSLKNLKRWWQVKTGRVETPLDGDVPYWAVSLVFHLLLLLLLARMIMPSKDDRTVNLAVDSSPELIELDELPPEIDIDDMVQEEIGANSENSFEAAADQAPIFDTVNEDTVDISLPSHDLGELLTNDDFMQATGESLSALPVKGSVGNAVSGATGAVDRLTQEIMMSTQERKTLVVWMFDQSASLMRQREEIQARFTKIYQELGALHKSTNESVADEDKLLLTQVYAFGSQVTPLLKEPTDDLPIVLEAIARIERDDTGIENVMTAVLDAAKQYAPLRKISRSTGEPERNVLLIIVSDEAGDDTQRVDEAVQVCTKLLMPVYVIGVPAPFGRTETQVKWIDPDPEFDQTPQFALVSQGPESIQSERLRLDFTGNFGDLDMIDSGFGPFHLTRLCYETGGIYFAVHPDRRLDRRVGMGQTSAYSANLQYFFDPAIMRRYKPDYVSQQTYIQRLQSNACRRALVQAAAFTTTGTLDSPRLRFPKTDEARFVNDVTIAQRAAAIVEPQINRLYEILRVGEEERSQELSRRWQVGYDLAMGRAIAAKVRAESYNAMLAMAKTKLKFDPAPDEDTPQNNTWVLQPADSIETGSQDLKLLEKARSYLTRVVQDHPGTPWAMLAQRELDTPLGWAWTQTYTAPPRPREPRNNNNNNPPEPQPMENVTPKTLRPPPRL